MYWLLRAAGETRERRRQRTRPQMPRAHRPRPNAGWSWDITKLPGPERGIYYDLLVLIDIFSRYVIGWTVIARESADAAEAFINDCLTAHGITDGQLTPHADRGSSMTSKPVAQLLVDLGVARSHSRRGGWASPGYLTAALVPAAATGLPHPLGPWACLTAAFGQGSGLARRAAHLALTSSCGWARPAHAEPQSCAARFLATAHRLAFLTGWAGQPPHVARRMVLTGSLHFRGLVVTHLRGRY